MALISSIPTFHEQEREKKKQQEQNQKESAKVSNPLYAPNALPNSKPFSAEEWFTQVTSPYALKQSTPSVQTNAVHKDGQVDPSIKNDSKIPVTNVVTDTKTDVQPQDDLLEQLAGMLKDGSSSSTVPDLMAAFKTNNEQAMKQSQTLSNNVYNREKDIYGLGKDLYYDQKNFNPLEADWAKQLLSYYGIESGEAADGAQAAGAADNGGNIDSYAAANAERQRLSKLNAGVNSISGMSQNRFNNMLATLQSIGVNTAELFGVEQKNTQAALENAGTTGNLAVSAGETQTAADLQGNQDLLSLYASLYGGGTTEGDGKNTVALTQNDIYDYLMRFLERYPESDYNNVKEGLKSVLSGYGIEDAVLDLMIDTAYKEHQDLNSDVQGPKK